MRSEVIIDKNKARIKELKALNELRKKQSEREAVELKHQELRKFASMFQQSILNNNELFKIVLQVTKSDNYPEEVSKQSIVCAKELQKQLDEELNNDNL